MSHYIDMTPTPLFTVIPRYIPDIPVTVPRPTFLSVDQILYSLFF